VLTSLSALTVQTPYDTPRIPANKMAVFAFQFDGLVHQPPMNEGIVWVCGHEQSEFVEGYLLASILPLDRDTWNHHPSRSSQHIKIIAMDRKGLMLTIVQGLELIRSPRECESCERVCRPLPATVTPNHPPCPLLVSPARAYIYSTFIHRRAPGIQ